MHPIARDYLRNALLKGSLHDAYRILWPLIETTPFQTNWHIQVIAEELERVFHSDKPEGIIFNVPPGTGKSSLVSVVAPIWFWLQDPTYRTIIASFDASLALRDARRHAEVMDSELWHGCGLDDHVALPRTSAAGYLVNLQHGWRYSTSIPKGRVTGYHADIHIYDDPVKPAEATKLNLQKAKDWTGTTAASRFRDINKRKRVLIMQRLHEDDPSGFFEEQGFTVFRFPMRFERAYAHPKDPRQEEGELLWPAFKPEEAVAALEKDLGPMASAAQLQQRPAPEGGAIFRKEWLRFWHPPDNVPQDIQLYPDAPRVPLPKHFRKQIQTWDMSFLDEETSDWVVGQVWGVSELGDAYLLDQVRGRWDAPTTAREMLRLSKKWPRARLKLVEKKANGPAVMSMLKKRLSSMKAIDPDGGKVARANAAAPMFESGSVYLPSPETCSWTPALLYEMFLFPKGKFDDQVDALSQGLNFLDRPRRRAKEERKAITW